MTILTRILPVGTAVMAISVNILTRTQRRNPIARALALAGVLLGISVLSSVSLAQELSGSIVGWGGQVIVPRSELHDLVQISVSASHSLALRDDGVIVAWEIRELLGLDRGAGGGALLLYSNESSTRLQHLTLEGTLNWGVDGVEINSHSFYDDQILQLTGDGMGGGVVLQREVSDSPEGCYLTAQRVDSTGVLQWGRGVYVTYHSYSHNEFLSRPIINAAGETIVIRFAFGVDGCNGLDGWYLDRVRVVGDTPAPPRRGAGRSGG